jgi:hypothetical protein
MVVLLYSVCIVFLYMESCIYVCVMCSFMIALGSIVGLCMLCMIALIMVCYY